MSLLLFAQIPKLWVSTDRVPLSICRTVICVCIWSSLWVEKWNSIEKNVARWWETRKSSPAQYKSWSRFSTVKFRKHWKGTFGWTWSISGWLSDDSGRVSSQLGGETQNMLEGFHFPSGLGAPGDSLGGAGTPLGCFALTAAAEI